MQWELETTGLTKRYGRLVANDAVDLRVAAGEVHAVMGENGAGKSTLMSMLYGLTRPDEGAILLRGQQVRLASSLDAIARGLGMVHQAFKLFEDLTVWENVVYGAEPRRFGFLDRRSACTRVQELAQRHHLAVDVRARVRDLSVGIRQRVEILKALYRDARILILDEPTAVLTPQERDGLFAIIRALRADGRTILFVTHKLHEVMELTDSVTVLRQGRVSARMRTAETDADAIIRAMTGRSVNLSVARSPATPGAEILRVEALRVPAPVRGAKPLVDDISLSLRAGEIVGIAGVAGNGQSELIEAITGLRAAEGRIHLNGQEISGRSVAARRAAGMAYVPEDRALTGTAAGARATEALLMGRQHDPAFARHGVQDGAAIAAHARDLIQAHDIRITSERTRVGTLSGGNLQKVVLARELDFDAPLLIAEQPTRGVDVGAIEAIHARLVAERDRGHGVLLVSAELSEILGLSDRILVIYEGRLIAELPGAEATEQHLGLLMAGRTQEVAR
ncbi:ABC transporter ATP-binding protein [Pseudooceanicola sp. CBS1P-1]|uniref:ATP-binding cassette domain-containing protein n=1 Tax=Pseudooceanicola albus TaxID=2692189 RepID=A0A6L7G6S5_9RHOB|nr:MULTISPECIES: ABC transporter ATP-binding protein [Pseudooceanicola]MBT9385940.1 ABC transporter ATP-binding protein [Pseudooceanicola endophyticus]MXN19639.1 ATP-binding cassette domain-containing protein [Pseudooceanicola albus]